MCVCVCLLFPDYELFLGGDRAIVNPLLARPRRHDRPASFSDVNNRGKNEAVDTAR